MSEVLARLQRAIDRHPERADVQRDLVRALLRRRRHADAAAAVLRMGKATGEVAMQRALAQEVLAHWLDRAAVRRSAGPRDDLTPDVCAALDRAGQLFEAGRPASAMGLLRRLRPDVATEREAIAAIDLLRGLMLERAGQLDDALSALNAAVQSSRRRARIAAALLQKGRILDRIRLRDGAVQHFQQVLRYDAGNMEAVGALLRSGEEVPAELAERWLEVVCRLDGRSAEEGLRDLLRQHLDDAG